MRASSSVRPAKLGARRRSGIQPPASIVARSAMRSLRESAGMPRDRRSATSASPSLSQNGRSLPGLAKQRVGVLVEEQRAQLARRVRRGDDVDAAVEEADGLEREAVRVARTYAALAVEDDAGRLAGATPSRSAPPRRASSR